MILSLVALVALVAVEGASARDVRAIDAPERRVAAWTAPAVDVDALRAEDEANRGRKDIPSRVGFPMKTSLSPANSGVWTTDAAGDRTWRLSIESEGALWIVVGFTEFRLQPGAELRVFGLERRNVMGPYTSADIRRHGQLWFPPLAGQDVLIELRWPASLGEQEPALLLGTVSHGYRAWGGIGAEKDALGGLSGSCNNDVECSEGDGWEAPIRSVVRLLSGGFGYCTGALINNTANDCAPIVLSANHCGVNPASTTYQFNYENSVCGGGTVETTHTLTGSTRLARDSSTDFDLLRLDQSPPEEWGVHFSGWNRGTAPGTRSTCIHHPNGDVKKISHNLDPLVDGSFAGGGWGPNHWRVTQWEDGTTEPSSSGGPLYDQNMRIVGQLHGGTASCNSVTWDEFGKFDGSWTGGGTAGSALASWLDPANTGSLTLDGIDATFCLTPQPTLEIDSVQVDESSGNGNGFVEPGETIEVYPTVLNRGTAAATNVSGTLSTTVAKVNVMVDQADWPDIGEGQMAAPSTALAIAVDPDFTCGDPIALRLDLTSDESAWSEDFTLSTGEYMGLETVFDDDVEGSADPWTSTPLVGSNNWFQSGVESNSPVRSWVVNDITTLSDSTLVLETIPALSPGSELRFYHLMDSEQGFDGGVLEFSTDGGTTWLDAGPYITQGGYNLAISSNYNSPIAGRLAWSGDSGGFQEIVVDFSSFSGMTMTLRWRFATDTAIGDRGWFVDDITITQGDYECVAPVAAPGEAASVNSDAQLLIDRVGGDYVLSWGAPTSGGPVDDYAIYSREFVPQRSSPVCEGTFGGTNAVLPALPDNKAFLIVARNAGGEGGYGTGRPRLARPVSSNPCP